MRLLSLLRQRIIFLIRNQFSQRLFQLLGQISCHFVLMLVFDHEPLSSNAGTMRTSISLSNQEINRTQSSRTISNCEVAKYCRATTSLDIPDKLKTSSEVRL